MKNADEFSAYHPLVGMLYFTLVIVFSMLFMHPVCLAVSFICAFSYSACLRGRRAVMRGLKFMLPMLIITASLNPLFSHRGQTILFYFPGGSPLTLESIIYGICASFMMITVISWFSCYNAVMTTDKFIYLFGKIIPSLSLVISMALQFVPRFRSHIKAASNAQKCIGRDASSGNIIERIKKALHIFSITVTWALENSIETADSMKSRGYGLQGRTSFSIYRFNKRDAAALIYILLCCAYIVTGAALGGVKIEFYPAVRFERSIYSVSLLTVYFALCAMPLFINGKEAVRWRKMKKNIC